MVGIANMYLIKFATSANKQQVAASLSLASLQCSRNKAKVGVA